MSTEERRPNRNWLKKKMRLTFWTLSNDTLESPQICGRICCGQMRLKLDSLDIKDNIMCCHKPNTLLLTPLKHGGGSIMLRGGFSSAGTGKLRV